MLAGFVSATVLCLIGVFIVYSVMKSQWGFGWRLLAGIIGLLLFLFGVGNFLLLPMLKPLPPIDIAEEPVVKDTLEQAWTAWQSEDWKSLYNLMWPAARDVSPPREQLYELWATQRKELYGDQPIPEALEQIQLSHSPSYVTLLVFELLVPDREQAAILWNLAREEGVTALQYTAGRYEFGAVLVKQGPEWKLIASPATLIVSTDGKPANKTMGALREVPGFGSKQPKTESDLPEETPAETPGLAPVAPEG